MSRSKNILGKTHVKCPRCGYEWYTKSKRRRLLCACCQKGFLNPNATLPKPRIPKPPKPRIPKPYIHRVKHKRSIIKQVHTEFLNVTLSNRLSVCSILEKHHNITHNDPEHLSTSFIKELIGTNKECAFEDE
jgi:ribosomal protein L37E